MESHNFALQITQVYSVLVLSVSNAPKLRKLSNEYMDKVQTSSMF